MNRYPDPDATLLRRRIAERYETEPGRIAVGNGSCEILLAAAEALCEPGAEILYAWPSFSMYPYLPALTGRARDPRAARRGRGPRPRGDGRRGDRRDPAADRLQPQQPDRAPTSRPPRSPPSASASPATSRSSSTRPTSSSRPTTTPTRPIDLLAEFPNLVVLRTFSKCYGLAGLRVGYAIGSAKFRAAVDAVRQPFSVNALAQAAGAEAILHSDDVAAPGREHDRRAGPGRVGPATSSASPTPRPRPTSPGSTSARPTRREVVAGLAERQIAVRPGTPLGDPGHLRVTYGTARRERPLPRRARRAARLNLATASLLQSQQ